MRWHGPALTESAAMHPWHSLPVVASRSRSGPRGFTLIEVMITVAVIAVLSALAYPAYTDYIRRGKRATAQAVLLELAGKQQTYLLELYRAGMRTAPDIMKASLENTQRMQAQQMDTVRGALPRTNRARRLSCRRSTRMS